MTYDQFVQEVKGKVSEGVKQNVAVYVHTACKNNGKTRKGLMLAEQGINISPTIYLEEYYSKFEQGITTTDIAEDIIRLYKEVRFRRSYNGVCLERYTKVKDKIIYHLVNYDKNKEMLEGVPYISYLDLAIVFYVLLEINSYGTATMLIRNEYATQWQVDKEELYRQAKENTRRLLPYEFMSMRAMMEEMTEVTLMDSDDSMYVLSNKIRSFGAAAVLYPGRLLSIAEYLKQNYYVLPSSVHEVIIIPESEAPGKELLVRMVTEINESQVEEEEVLSDNAYYYDRTIRKLI